MKVDESIDYKLRCFCVGTSWPLAVKIIRWRFGTSDKDSAFTQFPLTQTSFPAWNSKVISCYLCLAIFAILLFFYFAICYCYLLICYFCQIDTEIYVTIIQNWVYEFQKEITNLVSDGDGKFLISSSYDNTVKVRVRFIWFRQLGLSIWYQIPSADVRLATFKLQL